MPVDVDQSIVDRHTRRLAKLREFKAPDIIVQNEERFLGLARGEPYQTDQLEKATFAELRDLLGTWCWLNHSYSLDKAWSDLHWFLEPVVGPVYPTCPRYLEVGDPEQTVLTKAMKGEKPYPKDDLGDPVIRTLGSTDADCSGYNPPETCKLILQALQAVDVASWEELVPVRCALYKQENPDMPEEDVADCVANELSFAIEAFPILQSAYSRAVEKNFGVSCEYSL